MKKGAIIIFTSLVIVIVIWKLATFEMFEVKEIALSSYSMKARGYTIEINYVAAGATTTDVIQVRKVYDNGKIDIIKNIEGYNNLVSSYLAGDSLLHLVVENSGFYGRPPDTITAKFE